MKTPNLKKVDPSSSGKFKNKEEAELETKKLLKEMYDRLYLMFAHNKYSLLIILQGIDTSGKDGTVRNIFAGSNPQGVRVHSFKNPSEEELRHDFLWRCHEKMPESGFTVIFNRSYYEEVCTVKIHPEYLEAQRIPDEFVNDKKFFEKRMERINEFEKMLSQRGTVVLKFLLHISKDEQKQRIEERLKDPSKNWKFSPKDIAERKHWSGYQTAFSEMIEGTHTKHAPWHVIPADKKWYRDYMTAKIIVEALEGLKMEFPKVKNRKIKVV